MKYLALVSLLSCVLCTQGQTDGECYPPCGCFSNEPPWDDRPLPESPAEQEIVWMLYTQSNPIIGREITWDEDGNVILPPEYDQAKKSIFLVHGWGGSPGLFVSMVDMKDTFLAKYDYNMITVDWSTGAGKPLYLPAASNSRVVGACSAYIASEITNLDIVHCIGHSLGAHVCGYMGNHTEGALGKATGLDPAGPGFFEEDERLRLDMADAQFVDTVNTNSEGMFPALGLGIPIGHVDFYPNKGGIQPPCGPGASCAHSICKDYYQASIQEEGTENCHFWANPCDSEEDADAGLCETCTEGVDCQKMGYYSDEQPGRGTFYLRTTENYPFCEN